MGSCFAVTEVSKSILDKVIKPGSEGKDKMDWVEAQLGEAAQAARSQRPFSIHQSKVSHPQHYWHLGYIILCGTFFVDLCTVGCLAAS